MVWLFYLVPHLCLTSTAAISHSRCFPPTGLTSGALKQRGYKGNSQQGKMRKHRHLPLVAMFCLLLSGFVSVGAQQQEGKLRLLHLTLALYSHSLALFGVYCACPWDVVDGFWMFCSSAPTLLRVLGTQGLANAHGASPSMTPACAVPWRMLCRAPGCGTCTQGGPERVCRAVLTSLHV